MKRLCLTLGCGAAFGLAVIGSQREATPPALRDMPGLPRALGALQPRLAPDGSAVAFSYQGAIWTRRAGGTMSRLTEGEGFDIEPAWSPDGKRLAFVRSPNTQGGTVRLIQAGTGREVPLPRAVQAMGTYGAHKLEFHPDGRRLLGAFRADGKDHGLAWLDLETGASQSLTPLSIWGCHALSTDGKAIVYTTTLDDRTQQSGNDGPQTDLWKLPAEGGASEKLVRFPARICDLCWSADAQALFVVSDLGGAHNNLWKVPLSDPLRGMSQLTFGQADEDRPSVSRDGRWLAYTDNRGGATALVVRDLASGEERLLALDRLDYRRPTGTLRLRVVDAAGKQPTVARVSLQESKGKFHAPAGALYRVLRNRGHFYCDRTAELTLPAGTYRLAAARGPEYQVAHHEVTIEPGQTRELTVELARWRHLARDGWYSGENHIHANYGFGPWYNTPATMLQQCAGEDLNVCNFVVANSNGDGVFDRPFFRGGPDPLSTSETILYWNQEFRSTLWGHMTLVHLRQVVEPVFTGFKDTTNPWDIPTNADIADRTHWQNGVVNYTHIAQNPDDPLQNPYSAKALPVDAALGKVDTLDINNSWAGSVPVWHRLLNCGFRLPATAGTDCFLNRVASQLPGGDRVYVRLDGPLTYAAWIDGLKAGRSFVTNGPMLEFTVDGQKPGGVLKLPAARKVRVRATAHAQFPLTRAELLHNGKVVVTAALSADQLTATLDQEVALDRSGWLAFRASGPGHADSALPSLNAHTNPVYVEVAGTAVRSREDAVFFLKWLDQLEVLVRTRNRFPTPELARHALDQLDAARAVFGRIAREGN